MQHTTRTFTGQNNVPIFAQQWLPEGTPRAVILISHGYGEHSGRYAHVAAFLVEHGYAVYALDHRGHGQSGGPRVQVRALDDYLPDLHAYFEQVRAEQPGVPVVLYGHSMGSAIALLFAGRYQSDLAGLITTGTMLQLSTPPVLVAMIKGISRLPLNMRAIPGVPPEGLSRDPDVVRRYVEDPLVDTQPVRVTMAGALACGAEAAQQVLPTLRLPYLALHGGSDPITLPVGAEIVRQKSGSTDTTVKVYDALRHEIHNEPEQGQVFEDIAAWLAQHV